LNDRAVREWWFGKDLEGSGCGLIVRQYPGIYLDGLRKTMKTSVSIAVLSAPRFEPRTYWILSRSINHSTISLVMSCILSWNEI
jgi:hypothetical protein